MQPQSSSLFLGTTVFPGADRGLQSAGRQDQAAFHVKKDRREGPPLACTTEGGSQGGGQGGRGSLSGDGTGGKKHDEEDDDKNNHTDEDNHLHVLPPELPSHLL